MECRFGIDPFVVDSGCCVRLRITRVDRTKIGGVSGVRNEVDCWMVLRERSMNRKEDGGRFNI